MPVAMAAIDADRARIQAGYLLGRESARRVYGAQSTFDHSAVPTPMSGRDRRGNCAYDLGF